MSENAQHYNVRSAPPLSEVVLASRACCHPYSHHRYRPPSGHEIESLIAIGGWSQTMFAELVGVSSTNKGSATIRRWKCDPDSDSYRAIPYAAWRLALIETGIVQPGQ